LIQPYIGPNGVLTGTARLMQESRERREEELRRETVERRKRDVEKRRLELERQIASMRAELDTQVEDEAILSSDEANQVSADDITRRAIASVRGRTE
jgi:circadian clock protein KaiC